MGRGRSLNQTLGPPYDRVPTVLGMDERTEPVPPTGHGEWTGVGQRRGADTVLAGAYGAPPEPARGTSDWTPRSPVGRDQTPSRTG